MSNNPSPLTREAVIAALERIAPEIHRTPVLSSSIISGIASADELNLRVLFKAENLQKIGAFKIRGATHALSRLSAEELKNGVCTHSSGNHAQALALAARNRGVPAYIIMPEISVKNKVEATKGYGAEVTFSGPSATERESTMKEVQARTGALFVPPYNHPDIMVGQGTLALEFLDQSKEQGFPLDIIVAPCGGGGMLSGVALACHGTGVEVYGAEPSEGGADDCARSLRDPNGVRYKDVTAATIADGLRTPVGDLPWKIISNKDYVKNVFAVSEEHIKAALKLAVEKLKVLIEPSAAVPLAVVLFNEEFRNLLKARNGRMLNVGVVFSGGNTTLEALGKLFP